MDPILHKLLHLAVDDRRSLLVEVECGLGQLSVSLREVAIFQMTEEVVLAACGDDLLKKTLEKRVRSSE